MERRIAEERNKAVGREDGHLCKWTYGAQGCCDFYVVLEACEGELTRVYNKDGDLSCVFRPSKPADHGYCYFHNKVIEMRIVPINYNQYLLNI